MMPYESLRRNIYLKPEKINPQKIKQASIWNEVTPAKIKNILYDQRFSR